MKSLLLVLFFVSTKGEIPYQKCCKIDYAYVNGTCFNVPKNDTPWTNYSVVFTGKPDCLPNNNPKNTTKTATRFQNPDFYFADGGMFAPKYIANKVDYADFCLEYFDDDNGFVLGVVGCFEQAKEPEMSVNYVGKLIF